MAQKKKNAPKPRNPNDATFRNVRAVKARLTRLEDDLAILTSRVDALEPDAPNPTLETQVVHEHE